MLKHTVEAETAAAQAAAQLILKLLTVWSHTRNNRGQRCRKDACFVISSHRQLNRFAGPVLPNQFDEVVARADRLTAEGGNDVVDEHSRFVSTAAGIDTQHPRPTVDLIEMGCRGGAR